MKTIKSIFMAVVAVGFTTSCVNDSFDTPKQDDCVSPKYTNEVDAVLPMAKTKEVSDMYLIAPNPAVVNNISNAPTYIKNTVVTPPTTPREIPEFLEAYVISSDEGGNFYKSMYFQPLDGSKGFNLSIDEADMYNKKFEPGRKVFLKLNGLAYCNPLTSFACGLTFGAPPTDIYWVDRLPAYEYKKHLFSTCDVVSEDAIVTPITIAQATAPNNNYLNKLVEISNVQFKDYSPCKSLTYSNQLTDTSLTLTNGVTSTSIIIRTSRYATFAGNQVPSGNGTVRGVLTKYGSAYQIVLRTERDVKFNNPRIIPVIPPSPPAKIGALSTTFNATLNENFTSYTAPTNDATIPKYINQADVNTKFWDIKTFGGNKYLQTQAFGVTGAVKNYFVVPVDFTAANGISFKTLDGYNNGVPLKVYYSTNYTPGAKMNTVTLVDITSNFVLADGRLANPSTTNSYAGTFTPSGLYSFPVLLTGNGYIIFEYDGTCYTTTYQIDDIVIN